jgi:hypothetical protein
MLALASDSMPLSGPVPAGNQPPIASANAFTFTAAALAAVMSGVSLRKLSCRTFMFAPSIS